MGAQAALATHLREERARPSRGSAPRGDPNPLKGGKMVFAVAVAMMAMMWNTSFMDTVMDWVEGV